MGDLGALITAATGLLVALGAGVRWLWNKIEVRFAAIEKSLAKCEAGRAVKLTVIELLWQELQRLAPDAPVFARVEKLLGDLRREDAA